MAIWPNSSSLVACGRAPPGPPPGPAPGARAGHRPPAMGQRGRRRVQAAGVVAVGREGRVHLPAVVVAGAIAVVVLVRVAVTGVLAHDRRGPGPRRLVAVQPAAAVDALAAVVVGVEVSGLVGFAPLRVAVPLAVIQVIVARVAPPPAAARVP